MKFRPCIDIHNGKVKQIVGGSLLDNGNTASENFVSDKNADYYAKMYKQENLKGGHIILLNSPDSEYYLADLNQAKLALNEFTDGMQIGGGVNDKNAKEFLVMGASHVIVTSFVFNNGILDMEKLNSLLKSIPKQNLVIDLSCRKKGDDYYIVTDRWQNFTNMKVNSDTLEMLAQYCDEFLVHAVDVEGKSGGIDKNLLSILSQYKDIPITYAGGVHSFEDLQSLKQLGDNIIDVTIGTALDIFGGNLSFKSVIEYCK